MRKPMVTRSFNQIVVTCNVLNLATETACKRDFVLPRMPSNEKKMLVMLKNAYDTFDEKIVHVISTRVEKKLYGMTEFEFLTHAHELDENRHIIKN